MREWSYVAGHKQNKEDKNKISVYHRYIIQSSKRNELKNYLERRDMDCDILDLSLSNGDFKDSLEKISAGNYDIIGLSVDVDKQSEYFNIFLDIRSRLEKSGKKSMIVAGGQGGTHSYKSFIQKGKVDAVLLGFAEKCFYDLCF